MVKDKGTSSLFCAFLAPFVEKAVLFPLPYSMVKTKGFSSKIRNQIGLPALTTSTQHSTGNHSKNI